MAGADSIDDLGLIRHGAMPELFSGLRVPPTRSSQPAFRSSWAHGITG
ncbi:hypothetical protein [Nonomuraea sp. NPDC049400]